MRNLCWLSFSEMLAQARAGALLKSKDAELRSVHDSATAETAQQLADAESALAETHQQLEQVWAALVCCHVTCQTKLPSQVALA